MKTKPTAPLAMSPSSVSPRCTAIQQTIRNIRQASRVSIHTELAA